jgi:hypothetical protein
VTDTKLLAITETAPTNDATPDVKAEWKDLKKPQREAIRDMYAIEQSRRVFETQQRRLDELESEVKSLRSDRYELEKLRERRRLFKALNATAVVITGIGSLLTTVFASFSSETSTWFAVGVALMTFGLVLSAILAFISSK